MKRTSPDGEELSPPRRQGHETKGEDLLRLPGDQSTFSRRILLGRIEPTTDDQTHSPAHPLTRPPLAQTKRDECIATHGPESTECAKLIEAHKVCLRKEGFHVE